MNRFTINSDNRIDKKIEQDLRFIRTHVKEEFSEEIIALLLVGGLGRGEGGVLLDGDKIIVVNDFDLHMITKRPVSAVKLKEVCNRLARTIGVKGIDIFVQPFYAPILLRNTQYGYDLKHGSFLLYGNAKAVENLPNSRPIRKEIEKLLFTRSWCFLGPIKKKFFESNSLTTEENFFLFQQLSKAILALEEAWLIYQKDYCSSYLDKLDRIQKYCGDPNLLNYFKWATKFKLTPTYDISKNPIETYFEVKELFFQKMLTLINATYDKNFLSWDKYADWYSRRFDIFINYVLSIALNKNLSYNKLVKFHLSRILLAVAFTPEEFDQTLTKKVFELLGTGKSSCFVQNPVDAWWRLQKLTIREL